MRCDGCQLPLDLTKEDGGGDEEEEDDVESRLETLCVPDVSLGPEKLPGASVLERLTDLAKFLDSTVCAPHPSFLP